MVCSGRHPGDFHSVLPRARAASQTRTQDDSRGGRRNAGVVHAADPPRSRACVFLRLSALPEKKMAADLRPDLRCRDTAVLPAPPVQSFLRRASRWLVRAESSRRGFRRNVRGLAHAGVRLARALPGLEGAAEAGIPRRADAIARGKTASPPTRLSPRRPRLSQPQAQDLLRAETETLRGFVSRLLRQRSQGTVRRRAGGRRPVEGLRLVAPASPAVDELGLPMDQREEISRQQTAGPVD